MNQFSENFLDSLKDNIYDKGASEIYGFHRQGTVLIAATDAGETHIKITEATPEQVENLVWALQDSL